MYNTNNIFKWPYLLAKGHNGELFVGNNHEDAKHIVVFDEQLEYSRIIGDKGSGSKKFGVICGITVNKDFLYISDGKLNCIWKVNLCNGEVIGSFGEEGQKEKQFKQPAGLLLSAENKLFVCDRQNHRIQVFHEEIYKYEFGALGYSPTPGTLREPVDLAMNNNGNKLFITCWRSNTIQVFTPQGLYIEEISSFSVAPFFFDRPNGIFFTPDDHLLVASTHYILILTEGGTLVSAIEGEDKIKRFSDCIGVVMMNNRKIVIADGRYGTNRLVVF